MSAVPTRYQQFLLRGRTRLNLPYIFECKFPAKDGDFLHTLAGTFAPILAIAARLPNWDTIAEGLDVWDFRHEFRGS